MKDSEKLSEKLSELICFLRNSLNEYQYYYTKVGEQEKLQTDLIHRIELEASRYSERCKIATQLYKCLLDRRYYKDRLEERAPLAALLQDNQYKNILNALAQTLGEVRKVERYHENRLYKPRILKNKTDD